MDELYSGQPDLLVILLSQAVLVLVSLQVLQSDVNIVPLYPQNEVEIDRRFLLIDVENIENFEVGCDLSLRVGTIRPPCLLSGREVFIVGELRNPDQIAFSFVFLCQAVWIVVADQLGVDTSPVITAELTRLLDVNVEVEGPEGLAVISAGGGDKPPLMSTQWKSETLMLDSNDLALIEASHNLPSNIGVVKQYFSVGF